MSRKKRFLKIGCISGAVLAFLGYFAFSTFLFKPMESDWEYDVAGLIPRKVDFFVAKARLSYEIDEFPRLRVADKLEATPAWITLEASPAYQDWKRENDIDGLLARVKAEVDKLPLGASPEDIFGGKDLALAGQFKAGGLDQSDWAVYGRVNWMGKMGVAALGYPGLLGLDSQGLSVSEVGDTVELSGGQLERPIYVSRVRDVVVAGTSQELVQQAVDMEAAGGKDSLFLSAPYQDYIFREDRAPGDPEFELVLNVRTLTETLGLNGPFPDTESVSFLPAFLGRLIQLPSWKTVEGIVGMNEGMRVDLHGAFSSEKLTSFQERLYREDSFDRNELLNRAARLAPDDCVLFAYLHGPVADILRQAFECVDPALRSNLDDALRATGRYTGLDDVINQLGGALRNRTAIIVREHDYGPVMAKLQDGSGTEVAAQHDGSPVFAVTVVTWLVKGDSAAETLNEIRAAIGHNPDKFGLQGYDPNKPGDKGFYEFTSNGFQTKEFWSPLVPGTGMISTLFTDESEHFWLTNHEAMFRHVRSTYYEGKARGFPRLSELPQFRSLVDSALPGANLVLWINPKAAGGTLRKLARRAVEDGVMADVDWPRLRREEEGKVLKEMFPGKGRAQLSEAEVDRMNNAVDNRLDEWGDAFKSEQLPTLMAEQERSIQYLEAAQAILLMLDLNPSNFSLAARILTPLGQRE